MAKFHRIGRILRKKDKAGEYISLGDPNNRKFPYHLDIRIRDETDNVVFQGTDCFVTIQDPRANPNISEENKARIPEFILSELVVVERDENE